MIEGQLEKKLYSIQKKNNGDTYPIMTQIQWRRKRTNKYLTKPTHTKKIPRCEH